MPRGHTRITAILFASLVLVLGLGACSSPGATPPAPLAARAVDPRPDAAPLLAGVISRINQQGSVHSTVNGKLGLVGQLDGEGTVRYTDQGADLALAGHTQMSKTQPPQRVEVSIIDGIGYLKSPLLRPESGKPWLKITEEGGDFAAKLLRPALEQLQGATDPREAFSGVESATKIQSSNRENIDGQPVTRYDLRVLTAKATETTSDPQRQARLRKAAEAGKRELGYQLWIDESGLPVRFAATQDVAQAGQVSLTTHYQDWGVDTEIQAPPVRQVGLFRDATIPGAPRTPPR